MTRDEAAILSFEFRDPAKGSQRPASSTARQLLSADIGSAAMLKDAEFVEFLKVYLANKGYLQDGYSGDRSSVSSSGQTHHSTNILNGEGTIGASGQVSAGLEGRTSAQYSSGDFSAQSEGTYLAGARARGSASASASLKEKKLYASAEGEAFAGVEASGSASASYGNLASANVYGHAFAGAHAQGDASAALDLADGTFEANAGGEAFAGAKASSFDTSGRIGRSRRFGICGSWNRSQWSSERRLQKGEMQGDVEFGIVSRIGS